MKLSSIFTIVHLCLCATSSSQAREIYVGATLAAESEGTVGSTRGAAARRLRANNRGLQLEEATLLDNEQDGEIFENEHDGAAGVVENEPAGGELAVGQEVRRLDGKKKCRLKMYWKKGYFWQEGTCMLRR
jgi:hypothetical protein